MRRMVGWRPRSRACVRVVRVDGHGFGEVLFDWDLLDWVVPEASP